MKKSKYVILGVLIFLGLFVAEQIPVFMFGLMRGLEVSESIITLVVVPLLFFTCIIAIKLGEKNGYLDNREKFWSKKNISILLLIFALQRLFLYILNPFIVQKPTDTDNVITMVFGGSNFLLIFMSLCVLAPIAEELLCRGFIINYFFRDVVNQPISEDREMVGLLVSSAVFSIIHGEWNSISLVLYFSMGLSFGMAYYKTKRIEAAMLLHFVNNLLTMFKLMRLNLL